MSGSLTIKQKMQNVRGLIEARKDEIASALPNMVDAGRYVRVVYTSLAATPKLLNCDQSTLIGSIMEAAQLGLMTDGVIGEAYLVPYGSKCQLIVGYKGLLQLARRSGEIESVECRAVHANDWFKFGYGLSPKLDHTPAEGERGDLTHVYCVVRIKGGGVQWEVMSLDDVNKIRAQSKASNAGPWVSHYEAMALKTVLRRTLKLCPMATEVARVVAAEEMRDAGIQAEIVLPAEVDKEETVGEEAPSGSTSVPDDAEELTSL